MQNCRVCLQVSDKLCLLSDKYRNDFYYITGILLLPMDEYLCKSCLGRLLFSQKFRNEAVEADKWFKENYPIIKTEQIEEEEEEEYLIEALIENDPEPESQQIEERNEVPAAENLICGICPKFVSFKRKKGLIRHMHKFHRTEDPENTENTCPKVYVCDFCGQTFKKPSAFSFHMRTHTSEIQKCPEPDCTATFRQVSNFKKHFKEAHGTHKNPFPCGKCNESFSSISDLRLHQVQRHENMKGNKLRCPECDKGFSYPSQLKQHMVSHFGEKNFKCKVCEKSYFKASNLRRHYQNAHLEEYKRMVASGEFRRVKGDIDLEFKEEVKKVIKIRRYKCTEMDCYDSFNQIKQLQIHLETKHAIEPIWQCEDCDLTFEDLEMFTTHRKQMHSSTGPHACEECDKIFPYPSLLRNHVATVHRRETSVCEVCLRSFTRTSHLLRHYRKLHTSFYEKMVAMGKIRPRKLRK